MAKRGKSRKKPGSGFQVRGAYLWIIGGVVVVAFLFMLTRTLSTAVDRTVMIPILSNAGSSLTTLTRTMGDVEPPVFDRAALPDKMHEGLKQVDSLVAERDWLEAGELLRKLVKPASPDNAGPIHGYLGFCYHKAAGPDRALAEFRTALDESESEDVELRSQLAFCAGYLFQNYRYPDSALVYYATARSLLRDSTAALLPALLNNIGLANETLGDTAAAIDYYRDAAGLIDTSASDREARTLRDNLRHLARYRPDSTPGN